MAVRKANLKNNILTYFDWREEWVILWCTNGWEKYYAPMGYLERIEEPPDCPHCGEQLTHDSHIVKADDLTY